MTAFRIDVTPATRDVSNSTESCVFPRVRSRVYKRDKLIYSQFSVESESYKSSEVEF
jgi:hypothetical protein